jgi:hypothetical protein
MATVLSFPSEAQADAAYQALGDALNAVEAIERGVCAFAGSDVGDDIPLVTLENMGVVAKVVAECERKLEEIGKSLRDIKQSTFDLTAIRSEQLARREA